MRSALLWVSLGMTLFVGNVQAAADLDWLAGHWCRVEGELRVDEVWLAEAGGTLLGVSRTVRQGKTRMFEYMRIVRSGPDAGFYAQPNGKSVTRFAIADLGSDSVRFENPTHDFPQTIGYRREADALYAYIAGPGKNGQEKRIPFDYRLCVD